LLTQSRFASGAIMLSPREAVLNLPTYHPPLGGRSGLRLDFNENTVGCSPRVLERLRRIDFEELARYPEREPVEAAVASHLGMDSGETLLTNGVDEAIHLLCEAYLEPGDEVCIAVPTFSMYEIFAAATGARVVSVPAADNFAFPTDALRKAIHRATRLIVVANPNNPTGAAASLKDLLLIAESAPNAALLVDEAYFEFHGETLLREWRNYPNVFVARTFSKAYGLAGLRVGVLCGNREQITAVRRVASPYNVNGVALACLPEALADDAYVRQYVDEVRAGRTRLQSELENLGIPFWPSRANFVLMWLGELNSPFIRGMRDRGILVRDRSRDYGCTGCVRITLGSTEQTQKLLAALHQTLHQIGAVKQEARS
jgi:histidinol-phosphate aminotransferase